MDDKKKLALLEKLDALGVKKLVRHADNMRYILDLVVTALDERNSDEARMEAAEDMACNEHLHDNVAECREVFRNVANYKTDIGGLFWW